MARLGGLSAKNVGRLRLLLALGSGFGLAVAFSPYNVPVTAWCTPALLILASLDARGWMAGFGGFLHGAAFYSLTVPWIYTVLRVHGPMESWQAASLLALMVAVLSLFPALFAWGMAWLGRMSLERALFTAPLLWVALEFARTHMPHVGFPWNLLGYSVADHLGLAQLTTLTGIWGLSALVMAYNAMLVWLLVRRTRRVWLTWLLTTAVVVPVALIGHRFVPEELPSRRVHLVQTNLPQSTTGGASWYEQHAADLDELVRLSIEVGRSSPGLVVWPEVPAPFSLRDTRFAERAESIARETGGYLLLGVIEWKPGEAADASRLEPYNSAVLLDPAGQRVFSYDKIHLVPFGEYVPKRNWLGFAGPIVGSIGDFARGSEYAVGRLPGGRFSVFICYEAIFPDEVRRFVAQGAELLINISNDGWFGRSAAPDQHVAMARVRAMENRRWLLRATNNGYTVVVDPYGRIRARMATDVRGTLSGLYAFRTDRTLYTRFGDWLPWLSVALVVLLFFWPQREAARRA